jgi:hypothetical protein
LTIATLRPLLRYLTLDLFVPIMGLEAERISIALRLCGNEHARRGAPSTRADLR